MPNLILIDPFEFARDAQVLSACWEIADLDQRVHAELESQEGQVEFVLRGRVDSIRRYILELKVQGEFKVRCQRCLEPMAFTLNSNATLTVFGREEHLNDAVAQDDSLDAILIEDMLDVRALIEDEIIMGLSNAPRHEVCQSDALEKAKSGKPNPFAVLASLKTKQS